MELVVLALGISILTAAGALLACQPEQAPATPEQAPVKPEQAPAEPEPFTVEVYCVAPEVVAHFRTPKSVHGRSSATIHRTLTGQMDGYFIRPDAWWSRLGFERGDVVHRVNGWPLDSQERTMDAYRALQGEQTLAVELSRAGKRHLLVVQLDCSER